MYHLFFNSAGFARECSDKVRIILQGRLSDYADEYRDHNDLPDDRSRRFPLGLDGTTKKDRIIFCPNPIVEGAVTPSITNPLCSRNINTRLFEIRNFTIVYVGILYCFLLSSNKESSRLKQGPAIPTLRRIPHLLQSGTAYGSF